MSVVVAAGLASFPLYALVVSRGSDRDLVSQVAAFGNSGLVAPCWWWIVVVMLAAVAAYAVWQSGLRAAVVVWICMSVSGFAMIVMLMIVAESPWPELSYYPMKTLWACSVLLIPMATIGVLWTFTSAFRRLVV